MITVSDVSLKFGEKPLFKDVNLKFTPGNCYGIIGANGAGKSTFLKVLNGEIEHDSGEISISTGERMATLVQNHFAFDDYSVMETVKMGFPKLYELEKAKDAIYEKPDFSEEDGIKASEMEAEFGELGGYEAENDIEQMLSGLGLEEEFHDKMMRELDESQKVRVLLAQALFGKPDILLLDEPTNGLDLEAITWLEEFLMECENTVIVVNNHLESTHLSSEERNRYQEVLKGEVERDSAEAELWYILKKLSLHMADRAIQARTVNEFVETHSGYPIILCGDFNDTPVSYTRHTVATHLNDCFVSAGCGLGLSFNRKGFNLRIDHIMCSDDYEPVRCYVDNEMDASDHYPIVCWLKKARNQ